ncbi:unnamed protein product, partial [marine sediment metagenome]
WCEIGYILTNYSPRPYSSPPTEAQKNEAAAIQLAIWKYVENGRDSVTATDPTAVESRALVIYDAANGECLSGISGDSQLELKPDGALNVTGSLVSQNFTATVSEPAIGPLQGIELKFETTNGSFNSTGPPLTSKTLSTNASDKASVTLYWNVSQSPFGAKITVSTEGEWPVILNPTELRPDNREIQRLIILEPFKLSEEDQVAWQQQLGGLKVTKTVDWGNVTPFNSTFEICIEGTTSAQSYYGSPSCHNFTYPGSLTYTWTGLKPGSYNITETDAGTHWTVDVEPEKVTVASNETASANVTNTYGPGGLKVTKSIEWGNVTPFNSTFEICIAGTTSAQSYYGSPSCHNFTYPGSLTYTWTGL